MIFGIDKWWNQLLNKHQKEDKPQLDPLVIKRIEKFLEFKTKEVLNRCLYNHLSAENPLRKKKIEIFDSFKFVGFSYKDNKVEVKMEKIHLSYSDKDQKYFYLTKSEFKKIFLYKAHTLTLNERFVQQILKAFDEINIAVKEIEFDFENKVESVW